MMLGMCLTSMISIVVAGERPALFSADELCTHLDEAQQRVESLYVVYRSDDMSLMNREYPAGSFLHRVVAAKRSGYYLHWSAHGHDLLDWEDDPFQQRLFVTLDRWSNVNPVSNYFSSGKLAPSDPLPGSAPYEFIFSVTGLWPMNRPAPDFQGEPYYLHQIAGCGLYTEVRPNQEQVQTRWCHVLERPGMDRLWVDSERRGTLIARETHDPQTGSLVQRFELSEHVEASPDVWLPKRIRNLQYRKQESETVPEVAQDSMLTVLEISANSVRDDMFVFTAAPGALQITTGDAAPTQVVPGGIELLDRIAEWTRRNAIEKKSKSLMPSLLQWCVVGVGLLCIAVMEVRRQRSSERISPVKTVDNR